MAGRTIVLAISGGHLPAVAAVLLALERIYPDARAVASTTVEGGLDVWATPLERDQLEDEPEQPQPIRASEAIRERYRARH